MKKDCKSAGVDAISALETLENTLFGNEVRQQRSKNLDQKAKQMKMTVSKELIEQRKQL